MDAGMNVADAGVAAGFSVFTLGVLVGACFYAVAVTRQIDAAPARAPFS